MRLDVRIWFILSSISGLPFVNAYYRPVIAHGSDSIWVDVPFIGPDNDMNRSDERAASLSASIASRSLESRGSVVVDPATGSLDQSVPIQDRSGSKRRTQPLSFLPNVKKRSDGGLHLHLYRAPEDDSIHPILRHEQERNRINKRMSCPIDDSLDNDRSGGNLRDMNRDHWGSIARHHEELLRRGLVSSSLLRRSKNTFAIAPAVRPSLSNSIALDEDGSDVSYFSDIQIGSALKSFRCVMDTGSSDLWIPASDCTDTPCLNHESFGPSDSVTYKNLTAAWKIQYGSGAAKGVMVQDTLSVAGLTTQPVAFGTASHLSTSFVNFPADGILGLGSATAAAQKVPTFMDNLVSSGLITRKTVAFNLQRMLGRGTNTVDGQVSFGVIDTSKFSGPIVSTANVATGGLWEASVEGIHINGIPVPIGSDVTGIIDTGTTLLIAPPALATLMHSLIEGAQTDGKGSFTILCGTATTISLTFGGTRFFIDPRDYVGQASDSAGVRCISKIAGQTISGANKLLIGDVFLKNTYTVFDFDSQEISFGSKAALG